MRVTIATTKVCNHANDSFDEGVLRQLSQFREVPVRGYDGKPIGFAHNPEIDDGVLTAELVLHKQVPDGVYFSIAYMIQKASYVDDNIRLDRVKLMEVITVAHNFHAD